MKPCAIVAALGWLMLSAPVWAQNAGGAAAKPASGGGALRVSTVDDIKAEFEAVPCKNKERLAAVRDLLVRMGANADDVVVEKKGGVENLVLRKTGAGNADEKVVIGAHYDMKGDGCGAIDNWTGIVAIAHLYRTFKDVPLKKTLVFAAFGREEDGLVGSTQMVDNIKKEEVDSYCAMVNIDSLGLTAPQVADNMSSKPLEALAASVAAELGMAYAHAEIPNGDSDSTPFKKRKIPGVTIHGMTPDWPKILHSRNDQAARINPASVYLGYRLAASLIAHIDEADCQAYRERKPTKESKEKK